VVVEQPPVQFALGTTASACKAGPCGPEPRPAVLRRTGAAVRERVGVARSRSWSGAGRSAPVATAGTNVLRHNAAAAHWAPPCRNYSIATWRCPMLTPGTPRQRAAAGSLWRSGSIGRSRQTSYDPPRCLRGGRDVPAR
jgi:hypothetical protein